MSDLLQILREHEQRLEEYRRAFLADGRISGEEQTRLDRLSATIQEMRLAVQRSGATTGDRAGTTASRAAPEDAERRAAIDEALDRCVELQNNIDHLETAHPDRSDYVRVQLDRGGYFEELNRIAEQLHGIIASRGEMPARISRRLDEITREVVRLLEYQEPRASGASGPAQPRVEQAAASRAEEVTEFPDCCRRVLRAIPTQVSALRAAGHVATELAPLLTRAVTVEDMIVAEAVRAVTAGAADVVANEGFQEALQALPQAQRCRQIMGHWVYHQSRLSSHPEERGLVEYWEQLARMFGCD